MKGTKRAFITGIAGQDGSYLAELLLSKGYGVSGLVRGPQSDLTRIKHLLPDISLHHGDVTDTLNLAAILKGLQPDEIYNLAAKSFVPASWSEPIITADTTAMGVTSMLEALRVSCPQARLFQAASSEIFGDAVESPQRETTPFNPRTPYGVSKLYGYFMVANYRSRYGLHCSSGITYNHESPRRPKDFVTRKITAAVARIRAGQQKELRLGSLDTRRDWGFAGDYVKAMWLMLQADKAEDFVIATGVTHTVEELVALAFGRAGLDWKDHVVVDQSLVRPPEKTVLCGDSSRIREALGWKPEVQFADLIGQMVDHDMALLAGAVAAKTEDKAA